ncbi:hypothetical protein GOBAR_DD35289 [Gossypium barbadense]|nr:hypothetical protein GOBAR_DD35289 [Gossypium barbadense]
MSPAAVEFRSQDAFSTNAKPSSTPQNPEPTPHNFTAFPHSNHSQKNLGNAGEFDCGFGFDSSSGFHSKSAARLRPRLLKVRKQFNGKVKTGECEVESGFNPFKQSGQGSRPVGTIGNPSSSESMNRVNDDNSNNNNSSFVFGANNGSDRESSGHAEVENRNEEPLGNDGRVKLNPEKGESSDSSLSLDGCEGKIKLETGLQGSNNSNLDFTFGSSKSNLASNLDLEKPDFGGTLKVPDFCAAGFVFGSSQSDLKPTFSSHKIEPTNVVGEPSSTFGASNLNSSSFILERRSGENLGQPICSDFGKMNMEGETRSQKMEPSAVNFNANGSETWTGNGANSFFVFGATSYKSSSNECKDGINSSSEKFGFSLTKEKRSKKMRGKSRKSSLHKHWSEQYNVPQESSPQENQDSSQCYSPMDFSPYREIAEVDQLPKESAQDEGDQKCSKPNEENFGYDHQRTFFGDGPSREPVCESETAPTAFRSDCFSSSSAAGIAGAEGLNGTQENKQRTESCFSSGMEDERKFTFSATSTSGQGSLSLRKRQLRNKSKVKIGNASFIITPVLDVQGGSSSVQFSPCDPVECEQKDKFTHHSKEENDQFKQRSNSFTAAVHEACEMWRLRGNQAYRNENLSKAEEFYTQGINSVATNETSGCSVKPLVLCYSNRAATRISLGRIREALADCLMAAAFDPNFLKVNVRAGNCYLLLGETDNAIRYFNKCFSSGADVCLDRRIRVDAADGLQKAQRVDELTKHSAMLLEEKSSNAASSALDAISEALSISSRSEKLLEMKAEALYMLKRYEEAIQLCEQPLYVAENSSSEAEIDKQITSTDGCGCYSIAMLWRWNLMSKSYFYMGKLEKALELLQKLEHVGSWKDKHGSKILEMSVSLAVTIRELLRLKTAGNEAVCSGRYTEAVEHYSLALSSNVESRPFAAICFCNRAAAHQALGQIADAIADCSLAMALNENYTKAVSRRATLHEMIRDYGQASSDLQRLISILEKQCDKTSHQSGTKDKSTGNLKELRQAQRRLSSMQEEAKREIPLNLYLILGVKPSDSTSDVKKAYRKAALRHHPDKAGQFLARSETGDEGQLWKEIAEEIHKGADRLFKMIGEAYAVLSDTEKRSEYDLEEEIRKAPNKSKSNAYERARDDYGYHYERSSSRRYWRGNWNDYRNSHSRW